VDRVLRHEESIVGHGGGHVDEANSLLGGDLGDGAVEGNEPWMVAPIAPGGLRREQHVDPMLETLHEDLAHVIGRQSQW
jgi:hypothetical protein